jgi:hypothetical protein
MLQFQLFRIKVYPAAQGDLFDPERTRSEILREVITSLPSADFRSGLMWHIGNVTTIDESGLYFRLGRASREKLEIYDSSSHRFLDQDFETAPYTHVILDPELEVCGIAKKVRLAPTAANIAQRFARLMNASDLAHGIGATFEIDDIKDPEDFISQLANAYSISKFWMIVSRPNAFDADDFIKPLQQVLESANGEKAKAEIKGENLNSEQLARLARSAAASGDDAVAWMKPNKRAKRAKKQLRGNPANISQNDVADAKERKKLLTHLRELYRKIRGSNGN